MTGKLIKFEMRAGFRLLLLIWAALIAMTILMCIMISVSGLNSYQNMIHSQELLGIVSAIIGVISWIAYAALFAALVVLTLAIVIVRFYRGLLGDEGYLMHTLPVKEWQLITAKGFSASCAVIGSGIVGAISILLLSNTGNLIQIGQVFHDMGAAIGKEPILLLLGFELLILAILGVLKSVYQIYASISIGQLLDRYRILASLGAYVGICIVLSILAGIIMAVVNMTGAGEDFVLWITNHTAIITEDGLSGFAPSQVIMLLVFLAEAIQLAAFHVVSERLLSRKLNLL